MNELEETLKFFQPLRNLHSITIRRLKDVQKPSTLYRFQLCRKSRLYDKKLQQEDSEADDAVKISEDGLIRPGISDMVSNGALFMPNTFFMQELTRMSYDYYVDNLADSQQSMDPHYLRISKGTSIPSALILFRERDSRFWLQPSYPMSLNELNNTLTEFYFHSGMIIPAEKWLEKHEYSKAYEDLKDDWMHH
ncbi:hypothetical protein FQN54_008155 [Arachnomyces sp. PD_36]|nr:hypothetical protein FQN54_008155 [Arachnomyces sp. PD_36]